MLTKIIIASGVAVGLAFAIPKVAAWTAATVAVNSSPLIRNVAANAPRVQAENKAKYDEDVATLRGEGMTGIACVALLKQYRDAVPPPEDRSKYFDCTNWKLHRELAGITSPVIPTTY